MDDIPIIGQRELCREFENDRHGRLLLAKAFEVLGVGDRPVAADLHSVQTTPDRCRELLVLEEK